MVKTASTMLTLGTAAPDFSLPDPSGKIVSLSDFADSPVLLVAFICNHCPFVKHVAEGLAKLVKDYQPQGVAAVGINANDAAAYPDDAPPKMAEESKRRGYSFPYLYDETQQVAKAYRAACTPDLYVFDARAAAGLSRPVRRQPAGQRRPVRGADLRAALDAVLAGRRSAPIRNPAWAATSSGSPATSRVTSVSISFPRLCLRRSRANELGRTTLINRQNLRVSPWQRLGMWFSGEGKWQPGTEIRGCLDAGGACYGKREGRTSLDCF